MISLFNDSFSQEPSRNITFAEFINMLKSGEWQKLILNLRSKDEKGFKRLKKKLPAVTISGVFTTRKKIKNHSGYIALDIDRHDNELMRVQDLVDNECLAQYVSCSGQGIKIIYRCKVTIDPAEHRRIYDAAVERLEKKGIKLKVDPAVKSLGSLQYVSFDPNVFYNPKTKLVIKPLKPIKRKAITTISDTKTIDELVNYIEVLGKRDVTCDPGGYDKWLNIAFGLSYSLDEAGREIFHKLSCNHPKYTVDECNELYDACLERKEVNNIAQPITLSTVYSIINDYLPKVTLKHLIKKYNKGHAIGEGEDVQNGDILGLVRYKFFLFKKIFDKDSNVLIDLYPVSINLNEFEELINKKGFFRYGKTFVHIVNNIVEVCDADDVLRVVTKYIVKEGSYNFSYDKIEFHFTWEELIHKWREAKGLSNTYNQIPSGLEHWEPNLLKDTTTESYIPYRNGVVKVTAKDIELIPYDKIKQQIWRERILPRNFTLTDKKGMFEDFFMNVCGRGNTPKFKLQSEHYKRSFWYYGYMLHSCKRKSNARAWLLYDIKTGNNGRTGKTILGHAIGKIRNTVIIDGKRADFDNRFLFQKVNEWTDVIFIDDPDKRFSLVPLFNIITDELEADRKTISSLVTSVKIMIASNWVLESEGESEKGRQFVTQLDDFYVRYSKEHKDTLTPLVDLHGKEFFTDWNSSDWSQFDSFSVRALQYYFASEAPPNNIIGNSEQIRFIQNNERELFFELCNVFVKNVKRLKDNSLAVPQGLLVQTIRDHNSNIGSGIAGRISRDFLRAIGIRTTKLTSINTGGIDRMAYKFDEKFEDLNFGEHDNNLPKPKL